MKQRVILIFLDGVGLDTDKEKNPFTLAHTPNFNRLIHGKCILDFQTETDTVVFKGIDACLGVDGVPQSATGQTALFTGLNAPALLGYHFPAFPNEPLKRLISEHTLLKRVGEEEHTALFANAYTPTYFEQVKAGKRKHSVTTLSVIAAGLPFLTIRDLKEGRAVYWDITNRTLKDSYNLPVSSVTPEIAGKNLAAISKNYELVIYESFLPDVIGHKGLFKEAISVCELLDSFIGGILCHTGEETTVIVCSDHGNIEDMSLNDHTRNPALFLAAGRGAPLFSDIIAITDIAERILKLL
jgi:2,3-bisphosphoglycerate-independent phosphoglycerate mutase